MKKMNKLRKYYDKSNIVKRDTRGRLFGEFFSLNQASLSGPWVFKTVFKMAPVYTGTFSDGIG